MYSLIHNGSLTSFTVCHIEDRLAYATIRKDFDWRNVIFYDEAVVSSEIMVLPACIVLMATDTINASWQHFAGWVA